MKILVIDDDVHLRRTLRLTLEILGHAVTEAANGVQAQELLGRRPFDLAFLDLRLGREQGLDVLPALLRQVPGLPVVIITANTTDRSALEARRRGASGYLSKPFTPEELRGALACGGRGCRPARNPAAAENR
jgi:two-component system, NtrC family, response regulator AlgB